MKRIIILILSAAMLLSIMTFGASAESFTTSDALKILKHSVGVEVLNAADQAKYDLNGDGKVDTTDALEVLKKVVDSAPEAELGLADNQGVPVGGGTYKGETMELYGENWLVLEKKDGMALILSERTITAHGNSQYHKSEADVTWETSDLRKYLNGEYYDKLVNYPWEKVYEIVQITNKNPDNPWSKVKGGADTKDYVFVLSLDDVLKYFGNSGVTLDTSYGGAISDQYNNSRVAKNPSGSYEDTWWLRTPGFNSKEAAAITSDGRVWLHPGYPVTYTSAYIRPAMWIKL